MPLTYVTTIHPSGIDLWVETATPGVPTDAAPRLGSLVIVDITGAVAWYVKTVAASATYAQLAAMPAGSSGVMTTPQIIPVTLVTGNATTTVTTPSTNSWKVVDFWLSNSSGGAGAGTCQIQRGSDSANITDAVAPQAANVIVRAAQLLTANNSIAAGGTILCVRAGGFTAAVGWLLIAPA